MKLFLLLALLFSLPIYAKEASKVYKSFGAEYQATLTVVPADSDDTYYVSYQGFENHLDGSTLLYKKAPNDVGKGYHLKMVGMPTINFRNEGYQTLINGTVYPYSTVYLDNDSATKVVYVGPADIVQVNKIKAQYKTRQLNVLSVIDAKKQIQEELEKLNATCESTIDTDIDWDKFAAQGNKKSPAKLVAYLQALETVCSIDEDYLAAIQDINTIDVTPSKTPSLQQAKIVNSTLHIEIGDNVENLPERSYKLIYDTL